jgi:hypothetical protein
VVLVAVQPTGVIAATDTVSVCDDSGAPGTLRNVIANAMAGDIVTFSTTCSSSTITLLNTPIVLSKNLTIQGSGTVTISGGHTTTSQACRCSPSIAA